MPTRRWWLDRAAMATTAIVLTAGCAAGAAGNTGAAVVPPPEPGAASDFPPAPAVPSGPLDPDVARDLDLLFGSLGTDIDLDAIRRLGRAGDARVAWLLTDLIRFANEGTLERATRAAWEEVTGVTVPDRLAWGPTTDHLIAWDLPEPPGYIGWKRQLFELVDPRWARLFDDSEAEVDWRLVSWGGVLIDDRPLDETDEPCPRGCIPALDDPAVTDAEGGDWYPDDGIVFGLEIGGESMAFPKNIMEVHEMVNLTLGGRRVGMPYCTLCGSAQAYLTDDPTGLGGTDSFELRTSGLLSRSNKVMYEFHTGSVFDTFTGVALSGPLREAGVRLEQLTVVVSSWGEWKAAHPDTSIVAEDGGIGRTYDADPLQGRDDAGPIFPIGDTDARLAVHESVVGVVLDDGTTIAFPVESARLALTHGGPVELDGVQLLADGGGFIALVDDEPVAAHQAFWFAWSQFHPDTLLWWPDGSAPGSG